MGTEAGQDDAAQATRDAELAELHAKGLEAGRAQGLAETAALRESLQKLVTELAASRTAHDAKTAEAIADCAIAAIEGWIDTAPKQELLAPVVAAWIARAGSAPAIARVHPSGVVALQAAIGDAPITIEADPTIAPGNIKIRGEALDTSHAWPERLRELRDVIATALETP